MSRKLRPCFKSVKSLESIYVHLRFPKMRKYYPAKFEPLRFANFSLNKKSLGLLFVCLFFFQQFTPDLIVRATWLPQNDHNTKDLWMCVFSFSFPAIEIMVTQFIIKHRMSVFPSTWPCVLRTYLPLAVNCQVDHKLRRTKEDINTPLFFIYNTRNVTHP